MPRSSRTSRSTSAVSGPPWDSETCSETDEGVTLDRRDLLKGAVAMGILPLGCSPSTIGLPAGGVPGGAVRRVRPGDPSWPSAASWAHLDRDVGGRLIRVQSPLSRCQATSGSPECTEVVGRLKNPYYLGDEPGLTQTSGWLDGWTSTP